MPQIPRLMGQAADALLAHFALMNHIHADGIVTVEERHKKRASEQQVMHLFEKADAGIGFVMNAMKGGLETRSFKDKRKEWEATYQEPVCMADAREERPDRGHDQSAA